MEYNTSNSLIKFREYGRNLQELIEHAATIEDDAERQQVAEGLVKLMNQLSPQARNFEEQKAKLWHHLNFVAEDKLNIQMPDGLEFVPVESTYQKVEYPKNKIRFKHYGKNVETMVEAAKIETDRAKQEEFALIIASYMKMVYRNWSGENVSNEVVREDLKTLSNGILEIPEDANLNTLAKSSNNRRKFKSNSNYKSNSRSNSNNNSRSNNNNYKKRKSNNSYSSNNNNNRNKRKSYR